MINNNLHNKTIGYLMSIVHITLILCIYFLTIFSFNTTILSILFFGTTIMIILNKIYKDCPISSIEEQSFGTCVVDVFNKLFPIDYDKNRRYEAQLQYIFLIWTILGTKLLFSMIQSDLSNIVSIKYTNTDLKSILKL